jgi:hypothetical protein
MGIFCFGLSHQTAAVDVRERFVIPGSALPDALMRLKSMPGLDEVRGQLRSGFFREVLSKLENWRRIPSVPAVGLSVCPSPLSGSIRA